MGTIGSRIKEKRLELGLTQKDVGVSVGRSTGAVTQWEADMTRPNGQNLMKLAKLFDCSAEWLLTGTLDPFDQFDKRGIFSSAARQGQLILIFDMSEVTTYTELPIKPEHPLFLTSAAVGKGAFAIKLMDNETISTHDIKIPKGGVLVVDTDYPELTSVIGGFVLVHYKGAPMCSVKKLAFDGANFQLLATNISSPATPLDETVEIVGVIKQISVNF